MLKLSLKPGESLKIGKDVKVTVVLSTHQRIQLQIDAPKEVDIRREKMVAPKVVIAGSQKCLFQNCTNRTDIEETGMVNGGKRQNERFKS